MEELIDNDILISMVEIRPVIWDKNGLLYKDRYATKTAWEEVCRQLYKDYEIMSDREKKEFGKTVIRRWTNLRDAYSKYKRKVKQNKGLKIKKYVYNKQMHFLAKYYESAQLGEDDVSKIQILDSDDGLETRADDEKCEVTERSNLHQFNEVNIIESRTQRNGKRKSQLQQNANPNEKKAKTNKTKRSHIINENKNPHLSFFQGILPHLHKYDDDEVLQFQTGVLNLISTIDANKKSRSCRNISTKYFNAASTSISRGDLSTSSSDTSDSSEASIDFRIL